MSSEVATTGPLAAVLDSLAPRQVAHDKIDRDHWLRTRLTGITATEAKVLHKGSTADKAAIVKKKLEGDSFTGNQYTDWGNTREPELLRAAGATEYGWLVHAPGNTRHLATPDGLRKSWDGFAVVECKTSKFDIALGSPKFDDYGYLWQILWQMYCADTDEAIYVWEQHDDDWSRWKDRPMDRPEEWSAYGPKPIRLEVEHIVMTPELKTELEKMIAASNRALGRLDKKVKELRAERAGEEPSTPEEAEEKAVNDEERTRALRVMETQARLYRRTLDREKALGAEKTESLAELLKLSRAFYGDEDGEHELDPQREDKAGKVYRIGYSPAATKSTTTVDEEAAKAADPALWENLEKARVAYEAIRDQWQSHAANHTKTSTAPVPAKVAVTEKKGTISND